jgi:hypothetical protein
MYGRFGRNRSNRDRTPPGTGWGIETDIAQGPLARLPLVQEHAELHRSGPAVRKIVEEIAGGEPGIDDILDQDTCGSGYSFRS